MLEVCRESDIEEGESLGFELESGEQAFILRWQGRLHAYSNRCPHAGWPLNVTLNQFFNTDKNLIQCSNHMAMFDPDSGDCCSGPCIGEQLPRILLKTEMGKVFALPTESQIV